MKWSFALTDSGSLHIMQHEMPASKNLVVVEIVDRGGALLISAADAAPLRALFASPDITHVYQHTSPAAADELDDMLTAIHKMVEKRTARLRGEDIMP